MTNSTSLRSLLLAALLATGARAAFAEDPPVPSEPAPEAPAAEEPAPAGETPAGGTTAPAAPTGPRRWMLAIEHGPLRIVKDGGQTYHYSLLTVTNKTGVARTWQPFIVAETDTGGKHVACGCPGAVDQIRRRERDSSILSVEGSQGKIAPGEKKKIAAVFGPVSTSWSKLTLLVQGLVNPAVMHRVQKYGEGETAKVIINDAAYAERNEKLMEEVRKAAKESGGSVPAPKIEYQELLERRAYAIVWQRMGDEFRPEEDPIQWVSEGWRVLGEPTVLKTVVPKYAPGS